MPETDLTSFDDIESGYVTVDGNWCITSFNRKACDILGIDGKDILGRHCREIFYNDKRFSAICSQLEPLTRKKGSNSVQLNLGSPTTGKKNAISLRVITLPGQNGLMVGAIISFADLSEPLAASRLALNSIAEGVFTVDHTRRITSFNSAAEKITGWSEADVIGQPCKSIFHSSICHSTCAIAESILKKTAITDRMAYILSKDGHSIPVKVSAAPLVDLSDRIVGWVETFRDITASLQHEMILDAVADGVFTVDPEGRITSFNAAAERITGWKGSEVLGKICSVVFFSSPSVTSCALGVSMREKRTIVDYETFIIGKDGFSIPVSVSAAPFLDHRNEVLGGVETFRDNTFRLQNELILDSVADGVFTVDRNWTITSFNLAAELITGWSAGERRRQELQRGLPVLDLRPQLRHRRKSVHRESGIQPLHHHQDPQRSLAIGKHQRRPAGRPRRQRRRRGRDLPRPQRRDQSTPTVEQTLHLRADHQQESGDAATLRDHAGHREKREQRPDPG